MCTRKILAREMEGVHKDTTNQELASAIGIDPSTLTHFFKFDNELSFSNYLKAIKYLCPEREKEVMWEIIQILIEQENRQAARFSMEYLSTTNLIHELEEVISSQKKAPKENKDWAVCYELIAEYKTGKTRKGELLTKANRLNPKHTETKIVQKFLTLYAYLELEVYNLFFEITKEIKKEILCLKHEFIRESLLVRLHEMMSRAYLFAGNNSEKARYHANFVLNSTVICADFKYNSYYVVGMSHLFENYEECVLHLREYVSLLKQYGLSDVKNRVDYVLNNDLPFAKVLWGKDLKDVPTTDILESAHIKIKLGLHTEARELLESYEKKDDPYYLCYTGLLNGDPNLLIESLTKFVGTGNQFLANIPAKYLENFGSYAVVADSIMRNIKIA
jgi:hypothetical protein